MLGFFRKALLGIISVAFLIVSLGPNETTKIKRQIDQSIENSLETLRYDELKLVPGDYHLKILPSGEIRSKQNIDKMLAETSKKGGKSFTYISIEHGAYTMSAQGIDTKQYLVNSYLEGYAPFAVDNVMTPLYALAQRKSYQLDSKQYAGRVEVWQSSKQAFFYPRGDCEDHAIILADWLIEMGEDARVVLGDVKGQGHAWVILFREGKEYILEATRKSGLSPKSTYPLASLHTDYHPKYMFNRDSFWENTGSKFTTKYSSDKWSKKSVITQG
ncbi:MAG: hypothetical protein JXR18_02130 [Neptuniibacter sp.]